MAPKNFIKENIQLVSGLILLIFSLVLQFFFFYDFFSSDFNIFGVISYPILISLIIVTFFILISWYINKPFEISENKNANFKNRKFLSLEEYEKITKETTEREKEKLFASEEFGQMLISKGNNELLWNWQLRDKMREKTNQVSDDDLENLTVSSDENVEDSGPRGFNLD